MEPHVQRVVDVMCQTGSSERVFTNAQAVRDTMSQFDQSTQTGLHVTEHGQTGVESDVFAKVFVSKDVCAKKTNQTCKPTRLNKR